MKKLAMVLVLVMVFGIGTAMAQEERRPGPPSPYNEQFIYGIANINNVELVRQRGCIADFDLFYDELLFNLRGAAPLQICDALWLSAIVDAEVAMKLAYRFNPLRVRIVRIGLFELEEIDD